MAILEPGDIFGTNTSLEIGAGTGANQSGVAEEGSDTLTDEQLLKMIGYQPGQITDIVLQTKHDEDFNRAEGELGDTVTMLNYALDRGPRYILMSFDSRELSWLTQMSPQLVERAFIQEIGGIREIYSGKIIVVPEGQPITYNAERKEIVIPAARWMHYVVTNGGNVRIEEPAQLLGKPLRYDAVEFAKATGILSADGPTMHVGELAVDHLKQISPQRYQRIIDSVK
ncbi:hypothetical protein J4206_01280 [Candidatus Woesearchaeota archaeon]|nr:hypothetical protein [Candidatus Woesearchaeota archaeon]